MGSSWTVCCGWILNGDQRPGVGTDLRCRAHRDRHRVPSLAATRSGGDRSVFVANLGRLPQFQELPADAGVELIAVPVSPENVIRSIPAWCGAAYQRFDLAQSVRNLPTPRGGRRFTQPGAQDGGGRERLKSVRSTQAARRQVSYRPPRTAVPTTRRPSNDSTFRGFGELPSSD